MTVTNASDVSQSILQVPRNNLYANGYLIAFSDGSGEQLLQRPKMTFPASPKDRQHVLLYEENLNIIAWNYYKDAVVDASKYWYAIADANNIFNPFDLDALVGTSLLIPDINNVLAQI